MIKDKIQKLIKEITGKEAELEHPTNPKFGDYSTNIALREKINPQELIEKLKDNSLFEKVETAGPGFINFFLSKESLQEELEEIIKEKKDYGDLKIGKKEKVQVEFISANPTGPLTVGNARGGPFGDVLGNVLKKAGYDVEKAYYVNDYGNQIISLGHSVLKDSEAKYQGEYIDDLNKRIKEKDPEKAGREVVKIIVEEMIRKTTDKMGIEYDDWTFESEFHKSGKVDKLLNSLKEKGLIYEKEGAWWFCSSKYGDDKDRPVIKKDGTKTYLAGDIAHHDYKFNKKKFDKVINIWGADHHGDIKRLKAAVEVLGHEDKLDIIILQFVTLLEKGEKQKMSKRAGTYVTMDELLNDVGKDAARFFFLQKSPDTHLNFDIELAKEQSLKNPVFYIQYAYARIYSIIKGAPASWLGLEERKLRREIDKNNERYNRFDLLSHFSELNLIRQLIKYPEIIEQTSKDYQVQRLPQYAMDLARDFHKFYEDCRVLIPDDSDLMHARLDLVEATQIVLGNVFKNMGIEAKKKM